MTSPRLFGKRLIDCLKAAERHKSISEIIVVNDGSNDFKRLWSLLKNHPKVKLFNNPENYGVFTNKLEAIARASSDWVITCDSDNVMDGSYIDTAIASADDPNKWYCPCFAKPVFDYRELVGTYDLRNVGELLNLPMSHCAFNTGNQTVNRELFMSVFSKYRAVRRFDLLLPDYLSVGDKTRRSENWWLTYGACDSFIFNMLWLQSEKTICIHEGFEYDHCVHKQKSGSNYDRAPIEKELLATCLRQHLAKGTLMTMQ